MLYVNSINCVPLLAGISLVTGDLYNCLLDNRMYVVVLLLGAGLINVSIGRIYDYTLWAYLLFLLSLGVLLNATMFWCTIHNSAVATCIVGAIKAIFVTVIGFFTFNGQPITQLLLIGIALNTAGALIYA